MCGFVGFTSNKVDDGNKIINEMAKAIEHRGSDKVNFHCDEDISLGFRQLSFFGESHGKQPFQNEEKNLTIVYNGDVDNSPQSLLQLYKEHGEDMVHHAAAGFAFVIFDHTTSQLFAARDHFGIKPLYYAVIEGELVFASELKAFFAYPLFEKKINPEALEQYLSFQYSVLDESFFKGVFRLPPAHFLKFKDGEVQLQKYWQAEYSPQERPVDDIVNDIDDVVVKSVNRHKTEGALLSSGLDSSYITSVSKGLKKTFTVGFDYAGFSEIEMAEKLSEEKGIENFSKVITTEEFWGVLPKIQYYIDEPLADPAAVAFYFACQIAKENGIECVFSGEGADEFFGGYGIYKEPVDLAPLTRFPLGLRKALACVARAIPFKFKGKNYAIRAATPVEKRFIGNAYIFTEKERLDILKIPTGAKISDVVDPIYNVAKNQDDVTKMQHL
ncbi:MAG: asparagine synthase (glutamine-hydrolyzing), partial [Defluviitaleaceae bacterium]|nr:asparagine synthase (glutamine-hydrolyzing) [Defluviitaleaceae bacterium]